jgi:chromosome segregation ATPase
MPKPNAEEEEKKGSSSRSDDSVSAELAKLKAQMESFGELRKVFEEKFTHITETMGELRGMNIETNRDVQQMQVSTAKAVQMVEAVHPDALMGQVRKLEAKVEALKANIESNESRMDTILKELKELRNNLKSFSGIDKIVKLSQEVKEELINIKKVEGTAERHSDKIEGLYIDFQKRVREISEIESSVKETVKRLDSLSKNYDDIKTKVIEKAEKKELDGLISTSKEFERHITKSVTLLNSVFIEFEDQFTQRFEQKLKQIGEMEGILKELRKNSPNIDKSIDKIMEYVEAKQKEKKRLEKKEGFIGWLLGNFKKKKKARKEGDVDDDEVNTSEISEDDDDDGLTE